MKTGGIFAENGDKFIIDDFHHLLGRGQGGHHLLADGLFANVLDQFLDNIEVNVGLKQRYTNLAERLADIFFGDGALAAQIFEGALQFLERFSNIDSLSLAVDR